MRPPVSATVQRVQRHVGAIARKYPGAWEQLARFRAERRELGEWPAWCFCPLAGAYAIVSGGSNVPLPADRGLDIAAVGALGAWRMTQGVYVFDETLLDELWDTPVEGELPLEILYRLPEWSVYVATPGRSFGTMPLAGFFAHLEYDANDRRTELRLLLDTDAAEGPVLVPLPLHVWAGGGIAGAVRRFLEEAEFQARARGEFGDATQRVFAQAEGQALECAPVVSLLLYLCSANAELRAGSGADRKPRRRPPAETRAANAPTTWEVGYRLGAALRAARDRPDAAGPAAEGTTRARPAAHVRRAHWHSYWLGPRTGERRAELRWLHPILVGAGERVPVVRRVQGGREDA